MAETWGAPKVFTTISLFSGHLARRSLTVGFLLRCIASDFFCGQRDFFLFRETGDKELRSLGKSKLRYYRIPFIKISFFVYGFCFLAKLKNLRQLDILGNRNVSLGALQVGVGIFTNIFFSIISSILISYLRMVLIVARLCLPSL
jgi:hypothetical protein